MAANNIICLDIGEKRIGVARASVIARLAQPHSTILNNTDVYKNIANIVSQLSVDVIIVGLPRNTNDDDTAQTKFVRSFSKKLKEELDNISIEFQDEANTSQKAKSELEARKKLYEKNDIDSLAATYILQDYLDTHDRVAI